MKTYVSPDQYPNDSEIRSLLNGPDLQYKWGGELGTTTTLSYSFASNDTFRVDQAYQDSLTYYTTFFDAGSGFDVTLFDDPRYLPGPRRWGAGPAHDLPTGTGLGAVCTATYDPLPGSAQASGVSS